MMTRRNMELGARIMGRARLAVPSSKFHVPWAVGKGAAA